MKKILMLALCSCLTLSCLLCGCMPEGTPYVPTGGNSGTAPADSGETTPTEPAPTETTPTEPAPTEPAPTEPAPTEPPAPPVVEHSPMYIEDVSTDNMIAYFNEVCLDAEFSTGAGDASLVQKWEIPVVYRIDGTPTEQDLKVLNNYCAFLNSIHGFPGIREAGNGEIANLNIHFCSKDEMIQIMGSNFADADGGVTYWYHTATNDIYEAVICIRNDIDQEVRNSVILEEIYNGLGATQDTDLRTNSIIYSGYSTPQDLSAVDVRIIKLLYHPEIRTGMNATECATVIRKLYY